MIGVYAAKNRDLAVRATSSSGGVFRALCEYAVGRGGVVYGARYDSDMRVVHGRALTMGECEAFSGSKYVQSTQSSCFREVLEDLESGRFVLFSGTPCQIAGLKSYLALSRMVGKLLTVEVVCHGVLSPGVFRDHLDLIERRSGARVRGFLFRDKEGGWRGVHYRAMTGSGDLTNRLASSLGDLFNRGHALRPSCHECPFANLARGADLTIGDYWGIEKHFPDFEDDMGVSLVLVNSAEGQGAFDAIQQHLDFFELKIEQCLQPNLISPTPPSAHRARFWKTYERLGYERAIKRYTNYGFVRRHARRARRAIGRFLR